MATSSNRPDYDLFINLGSTEHPKTEKIGAAWKHKKGNGIFLKLNSLPINGEMVAFPCKGPKTTSDEASDIDSE